MPGSRYRYYKRRILRILEDSLGLKMFHSQKGQDRWVIREVFQGQQGGYFVDVGASDGVRGSNTYTLERHFGWKGICAEANAATFRRLTNNRRCHCVNSCIDGDRRLVKFVESGTVGGIVDDDVDNDPRRRPQLATSNRIVWKEAITLADLLARYDAPRTIEFLSIDVEGAETRILRTFPFHQHTFLAMCVERPTPALNRLLFENGYLFIRKSRVGDDTDSFYVHSSLPHIGRLQREPFSETPQKTC
jgi:FkbM family methyltransferase